MFDIYAQTDYQKSPLMDLAARELSRWSALCGDLLFTDALQMYSTFQV